MPMIVREARHQGREVWAWCQTDGRAGFTEVAYTERDGLTPLDAPPDGPAGGFGRVLFTLEDSAPTAQTLSLFSGTYEARDREEAKRWASHLACSLRDVYDDASVTIDLRPVRFLWWTVGWRVDWSAATAGVVVEPWVPPA